MKKAQLKAFTFVEIALVSSLILLILSVLITVLVQSSRRSDKESKLQDTYQKMALLDAQIKQDIRSSVQISEEASGVYRMKLHQFNAEINSTRDIVWWVSEEGLGATRTELSSGESKVYDFADVLDGKKFVLHLELP